jgi:hypothetical protein
VRPRSSSDAPRKMGSCCAHRISPCRPCGLRPPLWIVPTPSSLSVSRSHVLCPSFSSSPSRMVASLSLAHARVRGLFILHHQPIHLELHLQLGFSLSCLASDPFSIPLTTWCRRFSHISSDHLSTCNVPPSSSLGISTDPTRTHGRKRKGTAGVSSLLEATVSPHAQYCSE